MGARSIVVLKSSPSICVYFHWCDQIDEIRKIVEVARVGARSPGNDAAYALAAFTNAATNMVYEDQTGEKISIGVGLTEQFDERKFIIDGSWNVSQE